MVVALAFALAVAFAFAFAVAFAFAFAVAFAVAVAFAFAFALALALALLSVIPSEARNLLSPVLIPPDLPAMQQSLSSPRSLQKSLKPA